MNRINDAAALVGRVLLVLVFIGSGSQKFAHPQMFAALMAGDGVPLVTPLLYLSAIIEVGGGVLILLGIYARWLALLLFLFLIPVTIMIHIIPGGMMNQIQMMKNLAIMGGLLMLFANGPGAYSVMRE
jgi:putative oxidoreductase